MASVRQADVELKSFNIILQLGWIYSSSARPVSPAKIFFQKNLEEQKHHQKHSVPSNLLIFRYPSCKQLLLISSTQYDWKQLGRLHTQGKNPPTDPSDMLQLVSEACAMSKCKNNNLPSLKKTEGGFVSEQLPGNRQKTIKLTILWKNSTMLFFLI